MPKNRVQWMGILNVTPDSFSDGGRFFSRDQAIQQGIRLIEEGADILDIGGESTRPGAKDIAVADELERVIPVLSALRQYYPKLSLSVDTRKATVAQAAMDAGADWINDVSGLSDPKMLDVVVRTGAKLIVMHTQGTPSEMMSRAAYQDVVQEVYAFLQQSIAKVEAAGVLPDRIAIDPGIGFGKLTKDNLKLLAAIPKFCSLQQPVVIGASRKRWIGELTGMAVPDERVFGSIGAAIAAATLGATILRVHDVAPSRQAWAIYQAIYEGIS